MQFLLVSDPPGTSLQDRAVKARNELVTKLLDQWPRLAEVQLLFYEPGCTNAFQRLPQSLNCMVEDQDRYVPNIDDEGIDGDEKLYLQYLAETRQTRAGVAKNLADAVIRACQDAYEELPRARTFEARIMLFDDAGNIEPGPSQKFPASSLGQLEMNDGSSDDEADHTGGLPGELVRAINRLVASNAASYEQIRMEKGDIHQRILDVTDSNIRMLDKFQALVGSALNHSKLPPEHYELEATKLQMRADSQNAAMHANTKAAMAHERNQTVQAFIEKNPNFLQDLFATMTFLYQQRTGDAPGAPFHEPHNGTDDPPPHHDSPHDAETPSAGKEANDDDTTTPPTNDTQGTPGTPRAANTSNAASANTPSLCRGAQKLHALLDTSTITAMESNLAPDHWRALSPLLSCRDEAEFRLHINALTEALSRLPRASLVKFQMGLLRSIPLDTRGPLTELLGSYGLRIN